MQVTCHGCSQEFNSEEMTEWGIGIYLCEQCSKDVLRADSYRDAMNEERLMDALRNEKKVEGIR